MRLTGVFFFIGLATFLAGAGLLLPVVPEKAPPELWNDAAFEQARPKLQKAVLKLNQLTVELEKERFLPVTFQLEVKHGDVSRRHSILGSWTFGHSWSRDWRFGSWILPDVPFLEYNYETATVSLPQADLVAFLDWVDNADAYPESGLSPGSARITWAIERENDAFAFANLWLEEDSGRIVTGKREAPLDREMLATFIDEFCRFHPNLLVYRDDRKSGRSRGVHRLVYATPGYPRLAQWFIPDPVIEEDPELKDWFARFEAMRRIAAEPAPGG